MMSSADSSVPNDHQIETVGKTVESSIVESSAARRSLFVAALITVLVFTIEVVGGVVSGSVALLADACFMLVDGIALIAAWIYLSNYGGGDAEQGARDRFPYLIGFANGMILLLLSGLITYASIYHLWRNDLPVDGRIMFWTAAIGLIANLVCVLILRQVRASVTVDEARAHLINDLLGSLAVFAAAIAILSGSAGLRNPVVDCVLALGFASVMLTTGWLTVRGMVWSELANDDS
jgi:cobalt-zinc-cadmium efflux system protein